MKIIRSVICFYVLPVSIFNSDHTKVTFETNYLLTLFNTTGATSGAETAKPYEAPEFTPVFSGVRVTRSFVLCLCFVDHCLSFVPFLLAIVLPILLRYMDSDYLFGIFKLFLLLCISFNSGYLALHITESVM
jgi:hypothetical protein